MDSKPRIINITVGGKNYALPRTDIQPLTTEAFEYLTKRRGLRKDTLEAYRLGTNTAGEIVIPFYDENDQLALVKFRHPTGGLIRRGEKEMKTICEPNGKPVLLGSHLCDPNEGPLTICFGDFDSMVCAQDGIPNSVSVPFGDKGFGWIDAQWNFLERFSEIIIYPDNDNYPTPDAELAAARKLEELALRLGKYRTRMVSKSDMHGAKDANELLLNRGAGANRTAIERAEWFPSGIVAVADYVGPEQAKGIPTGLPDIDRATGGLSGGQLIVLSGDNGGGKTTKALNVCANFIDEGIPVLVWSGEQSIDKIRNWFERIAAGPINLRKVIDAKTGYENFYPLEEVAPTIRNWYRDFLFQFKELSLEKEKFFADAELGVRRHGCGLVVIDNLMAFTGGEGEGYYQTQGDFAESCKRFAEVWNIPVILICHNKKEKEQGNGKPCLPDKNSVEGSKKITNWADVVFQMYRVSELNKQDYSGADAILRLCKSRESGILEDVRLTFDRDSKRFRQTSENGLIEKEFGWEL